MSSPSVRIRANLGLGEIPSMRMSLHFLPDWYRQVWYGRLQIRPDKAFFRPVGSSTLRRRRTPSDIEALHSTRTEFFRFWSPLVFPSTILVERVHRQRTFLSKVASPLHPVHYENPVYAPTSRSRCLPRQFCAVPVWAQGWL